MAEYNIVYDPRTRRNIVHRTDEAGYAATNTTVASLIEKGVAPTSGVGSNTLERLSQYNENTSNRTAKGNPLNFSPSAAWGQ